MDGERSAPARPGSPGSRHVGVQSRAAQIACLARFVCLDCFDEGAKVRLDLLAVVLARMKPDLDRAN